MNETDLPSGALNTNFASAFAWSKLWIPQMRKIIGPHLLRESSFEEDTKQATDLIVLKAQGLRIACRLRTPGYAADYGEEITMTCRRESGAACEWHKMILGDWGDWFFYGHATHQTPSVGDVRPYFLIDLAKARPILRCKKWMESGPNKDDFGKRCWFHAFHVHSLLAETVIAELPPAYELPDPLSFLPPLTPL